MKNLFFLNEINFHSAVFRYIFLEMMIFHLKCMKMNNKLGWSNFIKILTIFEGLLHRETKKLMESFNEENFLYDLNFKIAMYFSMFY